MNSILPINAHIKYVEFILHAFDNYPDTTTLGDLRNEFNEKFSTLHTLLNQNFGLYRLLPLILIREEYKNDSKISEEIGQKVRQIRNSIAHNDFSMNEEGYQFNNGKNSLSFTYSEFIDFIHKIENDFLQGTKL